MIRVFVPGIPRPQGSKNAYIRGGRAILVEANKYLPAWRQQITRAVEMANSQSIDAMEGAIVLNVDFFMPKAKSNKKDSPFQKPDLDKLIRAIMDSCTKAGAIRDDAQVCAIQATKAWEYEGQQPGVLIELYEMPTL
jgi:Holliday junction resolvase RusA-like endonuclease